jgi:hypothetical protein
VPADLHQGVVEKLKQFLIDLSRAASPALVAE